MRKISLSVLTLLIFSFVTSGSFVSNLSAGGSEEHFELRQVGGAGGTFQITPPAPAMPGVDTFDEPAANDDAVQETFIQDEPAIDEETWTQDAPRRKGWRSFLPKSGPQGTENEEAFQENFTWWPTDATPGPVKDLERGGYWWWPNTPGQARPWGNRGHIYVRKIIFDYKEVPTTSLEQLKPSLVVKKIHNNVKIFFDFDKAEIREDAIPILTKAVRLLKKYDETDVLITGHADTRGSESYNQELGERRADAVRQYILSQDIPANRIRILSRGKLDAVAPVTDIVALQKDRNAQFMVAEVVEVMIPESQRHLYEPVGEPEVEALEGEIRVGFREYTIQEGDTLGELAQQVYGNVNRWEYIYNFNRDVISDPHSLQVGSVIKIPEE